MISPWNLEDRIKQVRSVLEHVGLYVGLAVYTAAGAKVFSGGGKP